METKPSQERICPALSLKSSKIAQEWNNLSIYIDQLKAPTHIGNLINANFDRKIYNYSKKSGWNAGAKPDSPVRDYLLSSHETAAFFAAEIPANYSETYAFSPFDCSEGAFSSRRIDQRSPRSLPVLSRVKGQTRNTCMPVVDKLVQNIKHHYALVQRYRYYKKLNDNVSSSVASPPTASASSRPSSGIHQPPDILGSASRTSTINHSRSPQKPSGTGLINQRDLLQRRVISVLKPRKSFHSS